MVKNLPSSQTINHSLGFLKRIVQYHRLDATLGIGSSKLSLSTSVQVWFKNFQCRWTQSATYRGLCNAFTLSGRSSTLHVSFRLNPNFQHQETPCYHKCLNGSCLDDRKKISWFLTIHNQEGWVTGTTELCFMGITGGYPRQSVEMLYWKYYMRVIQEFLGCSLWLVVTFGDLRWMQILNCVWVIVTCAKRVQICLELEHCIHRNG